jgi:hypothetical protein
MKRLLGVAALLLHGGHSGARAATTVNSHTLYLNNCLPNGCTTHVGATNALTDTSDIPSRTSTIAARFGLLGRTEWLAGEGIDQNLVAASGLDHREQVTQVATGTVEIMARLPLELPGRVRPVLTQRRSAARSAELGDLPQQFFDIRWERVLSVAEHVGERIVPDSIWHCERLAS